MPKFKTLSLNDSPSAPDSIGREPGHAEAGSKTHIRQSSLYSQRKRQPRRKRREADSLTLPVKERADDVRSSDLDPTNKDLSKVDELLLDDEPYIPGLTHSKGSAGPDSTFAKPSAHKEASQPLSKWLQELEDYAREHTINSLEEFFEYMRPPQGYPSPETKVVEDEAMTHQQSSQERSILAPEHAQLDPAEGQYADDSDKEIAQNGMKWMSEEAMVAFQKYIAETDDLKGYDYRFDELLLQCFTVEHYYKIFHHFNFTVKMKVASATEWTSKLYFAEVHEMLGEKIYFCSPLEPDENGNCFACKNQGMDDLKHPIVGVFDRGSPDLSFPYTYSSGSDDEAWL
ncbi:uncharacterized protein LOC102711923 [Oryza brachyantha]|uniref:uncharacterized protein LOC102711923 n=1 Tax=Oryza brachyantha TaxID=4533 RepID=UPI001ADB6264|nr:uncharacterized protein LOC102711923 [Oryza brachyantha]